MPRKNTRTAVAAFVRGEPAHPSDSIWTDGAALWSYGTALATLTLDGTAVALNRTRYSTTTSQQQGGVHALLTHEWRLKVVPVDGLPRGVTPTMLREYAERVHRPTQSNPAA